jgi:pimeloyl-ACP methyl ester carboxylesterase
MSGDFEAEERNIEVSGQTIRILEKGDGPVVGFLPTFGGIPRWNPLLEGLSDSHRVVAPSLPGFPGGGRAHEVLDNLSDWLSFLLDSLEASGLDGADPIGHGLGGALAEEVAAFCPPYVSRLVLISPLGLFDVDDPVTDIFAQELPNQPPLLSVFPERYIEDIRCPDDEDEMEWQVMRARCDAAAARLLWPNGELGLRKRLHRIRAKTLLLWAAEDDLVPVSYAERFAEGIGGPCSVTSIAGSGHRVNLDAPDETVKAISEFLS